MKTEIITTVEQFHALQGEWNALVGRMEFPEIFYKWEWNWCYYEYCRSNAPLFIVTARQNGLLVGLAPMCVTRRTSFGQNVRVLEMIVGNMADYRNFLIDNSANRRRIVQDMLAALQERRVQWDVVEIRELPSRDNTALQLADLVSQVPDLRWSLVPMCRTSRIYYRTNWADKMESKYVHRIDNKRRQLTKDRNLECVVGHPYTDEFWHAFIELHQVRWPHSPLHQKSGAKLFADLRLRLGAGDGLDCSWVTLDGEMAAMHFGFRDQKKLYYYMPVMAEKFRADRVGNLLMLAMVNHYASTHQEFDFLRGDESYKFWWTDDIEVNYRMRIFSRNNLSAVGDSLLPATKEYVRALALPGYVASRLRNLRHKRHDAID